MVWLLVVWTLTTSGVEVEQTWWPTLEACHLAARASWAWRVPGRADGTGTLVGVCRPILPAGQISPRTGGA